jgi:hypothetical protein
LRILLDECVDRRLADELAGHEVMATYQEGWAGIKNGDLLRIASEEFDVFLTVDRNLSFQQPIPNFDIAVVVMRVQSNRLPELKLLVPKLLEVLPSVKAGAVTWVGI